MKAVDTSQKETTESLQNAFQDLDALMAKAAEMVALAESITVKLSNSNSNSSGSGNKEAPAAGDPVDDEQIQFQQITLSLGISNPVTR